MLNRPTVDRKNTGYRRLPRFARRPGFTLVELLVVAAIAFILLGLILGWAVSAFRTNKIRTTQLTMNGALAMVNELRQTALVVPDHRFANFYWAQPHTAAPGTTPVWGGTAGARPLSSGEFLIWLGTHTGATAPMVESLKPAPPLSPPPGAVVLANGNILVDIFEQDPTQADPLLKDAASTSFTLVTDHDGYPLRTLMDAWGHELVYRLSAHHQLLNLPDAAGAPPNPPIRERVIQDEAVAAQRLAAAGLPAPAGEILRPAISSYDHPQWMSAGPDGKWGRFTDGSPPLHNALADRAANRDDDAKDNLYSIEWGR